jgi:hypothetical protein
MKSNKRNSVLCALLAMALSQTAFADCEKQYENKIEEIGDDLPKVRDGALAVSILTLGVGAVVAAPYGLVQSKKMRGKIKDYKKVVQLLVDARAGEGTQLRDVYLKAIKASKSKTEAPSKMNIEEFADQVRRANDKDVFCGGRLSSLGDIQKWANQMVNEEELKN